ncbi:nucleoporin Nup2p [[Candida] railenensis]|uniref:Nucleoporin Nup2p n=1 Tax=[Candida] railenensis TaxID=45579 RepID=A0A9P0W0E7_9ASCO|nr:nucleoporin Nup2p [[Candida] railenensis]
MSKRQARDQLTKEPWERQTGSDSEEDTSSKGPVTASQAVLAKRKIIKPRSRAGGAGSLGGNAFGGIAANGSAPVSNGFNFGATTKPSIPNANAFGGFGTIKSSPAATASATKAPVSTPSTTSSASSDINEKIKALNENFVHSIVKANTPNTIVDFTSIAEKYIQYYKNIQENKLNGAGKPSPAPAATTSQAAAPAATLAPVEAAAPAKTDSIDVDSDSDSDSDEDIKIEGPKFTLTSKPTVKSSPFSFGPKVEKKKADSDSDSESEIEIKGPTFQFNKTIKDSVFKVKGTEASKVAEEPPKPAFSFGAVEKKTEEKPTGFSFGAPPAPSESKPTFGTNASATTSSFSFGSTTSASSAPATAPSFNFGSKANEPPKDEAPKPFSFASNTSTSAKPSFNFGASAPVTKPVEESKPSFSFGSKPVDAAVEKPAFSFGSSTSENKPTESKPAFSFGSSTSESKPTEAKPAFTFGATPEVKPAESKPAVSFGTVSEAKSTDSKPAFTFGAVPASSTGSKPAFAFGSQPSATPPSSEPKPAFSFGSSSSNAFGAAQAKPAGAFNFSFNATPAASTNDSTAAEDEAADEEEPKVNFKPVAQLASEKIGNAQTGEEDEEVLYTKRTKLMLFDPSNKEQPYVNKGLGDVKVLKNKDSQKARILIRADGGLRVLLNTLVNKDVQYDTIGNGSMVRVPTVKEDKSIETFILKVKTPADGAELLKSLNDSK